MWDPKTSIFAVPLVQQTGTDYFSGLAVYRLDKQKGFTNKGLLDHKTLSTTWLEEQCATQRKAAPKAKPAQLPYCNPVYQRQYRAQFPISRSIIIDQFIVSLSNLGFEIHALENLDVKAAIPWTFVQKKKAVIARSSQ